MVYISKKYVIQLDLLVYAFVYFKFELSQNKQFENISTMPF